MAKLSHALEYSAKNLFTILSLCAQNRFVQFIRLVKIQDGDPDGYTICLNDRVTSDKNARGTFAKYIKKYLSYCDPNIIHAAFAPMVTQDNLYKIVTKKTGNSLSLKDLKGTKKALNNIQDVKFFYKQDK
jgi:hypothetical protein